MTNTSTVPVASLPGVILSTRPHSRGPLQPRVTESTAYQPEWSRPDSPTASLNDTDLRAYYKAHSVRGDARFALACGLPVELAAAWSTLLTAVDNARSETPVQRKRRDVLRNVTRAWIANDHDWRTRHGWREQAPVVVASKPIKAKRAPCVCCGR
jgi:hypothetical protein